MFATKEQLTNRPIERKVSAWKATAAKYGLTEDQLMALVETQRGLCAICKDRLKFGIGAGGAVIDHDHTTDKVRGILCTRCNVALGMLKDSPKNAISAAEYLETRALNK